MQKQLKLLGWQAALIPGIVGALLYCVFTFMAFLFFPIAFSPFERFLSELGMYSLNPNGATFYYIAIVALGCSLFPFFVGVYAWLTNRQWKRRGQIALIAGVFSASSLLMTGVFFGDFPVLHFIWAMAFFFSFALAFVAVNAALFFQQRLGKAISLFGFLVILFDSCFLLQVLLGGSPIVAITEWITVFSFLGWVGVVAVYILCDSREK
jgi:hypothetical protein